MTTKVLRRPEVQLGACEQDGCMLLRQYGEVGQQMACAVWECVSCGQVTYDDANDEDRKVATAVRTAA